MPRYYFHSSSGQRELDDEGVELSDTAAARVEAARYAGHLLGDNPELINDVDTLRIEVTDEDGCLCCVVLIASVDARRKIERPAPPK
ncbi:hypothetical protein AOA14_16195 [Sphingopyxis terrae subsp. terrae NBRC 15098]|uniref:DUF6894 domain-containing protein n=1 Tax=Sphingopyxis terrae subsp. terrae NBRC 15098 TaxID=1219058 RepID=A0A142W3L3_9SPHN|nr:hypothetical protein [Sphingopyxis terrae]AMU96147.1 hypothetical protein AOA14_16195 [Sphingopyxis terrae subsp. terrae NBRC 15098]